MLTKNRSVVCFALSSLVVGLFAQPVVAGKEPRTVVAIPPRLRIVQLVQDVQTQRDLTVICYQGKVDAEDPTLHVLEGRVWKKVSLAEFKTGQVPDKMILIGDNKSIPLALIDASTQCENVEQVESFDVAVVAAALGKSLALGPEDVTWLAKRNGFAVNDKNADRRRYGRFGKPGTKRTPPETAEVTTSDISVPPEPELAPTTEKPAVDEQAVAAPKEDPMALEPALPSDKAPKKSKTVVKPEEK